MDTEGTEPNRTDDGSAADTENTGHDGNDNGFITEVEGAELEQKSIENDATNDDKDILTDLSFDNRDKSNSDRKVKRVTQTDTDVSITMGKESYKNTSDLEIDTMTANDDGKSSSMKTFAMAGLVPHDNTRPQNISAMTFFVHSGYRNTLEQYYKYVAKHDTVGPFLSLSSIHRIESPHKVKSLRISTRKNYTHAEELQILADVINATGGGVLGCNFAAIEFYQKWNKRHSSVCYTIDHFNGSYGVVCANPGVKCLKLVLKILYCNFEAYSYEPRYKAWDHTILAETVCFRSARQYTRQRFVSWSMDSKDFCDKLYVDNVLQIKFTPQQFCQCMDYYDDVYLIGTSHIAIFGDFLMHTCRGLDLTPHKVGLKHGNLNGGNIHFADGRFTDRMYTVLHSNLTAWLENKTRVAIWIQTGSWDFTYRNLNYAMHEALDYYKKSVQLILSQAALQGVRVDLRVLASPPMPTGFHWNSFAITAFNVRLQQMTRKLGVEFIDAFAVIEPCREDYARMGSNKNHYLQRLGNEFSGTVGQNFYLGVFLPQVCPIV